jgi:uncharacterized protein with HEPN domain
MSTLSRIVATLDYSLVNQILLVAENLQSRDLNSVTIAYSTRLRRRAANYIIEWQRDGTPQFEYQQLVDMRSVLIDRYSLRPQIVSNQVLSNQSVLLTVAHANLSVPHQENLVHHFQEVQLLQIM